MLKDLLEHKLLHCNKMNDYERLFNFNCNSYYCYALFVVRCSLKIYCIQFLFDTKTIKKKTAKQNKQIDLMEYKLYMVFLTLTRKEKTQQQYARFIE